MVHISDLHFGPEFQTAVFEKAVDEINNLEPDVLVASGDLTENGLVSQYRNAKRALDSLTCKKRVFCSGNHDYRSTGYLLFKEFFPTKPTLKVDGVIFAVISTARPERNEGEVGHRQVLWLEETFSKYKRLKKIAVIHHHLIQVPDTGPDNIPVIDAGDTLRTIIECKVPLVLGGHRHRPWRWNIGSTQIVHAGTLSSERTRGFYVHSYNTIEISRDNIDVRLRIVGAKRSIRFDEVVK
ncbi:MAG TPA: metallophosphoesterase family protein, partial [Terriglobales bacterium]|nr:metallophosphoesterase family protein [Terriglobales bacterium]